MKFAGAAMVMLLATGIAFPDSASASGQSRCLERTVSICGGVASREEQGNFHGLIDVTGEPWVLNAAAHSGTTAGCGDCVWTLVVHCQDNRTDSDRDVDGCVTALNSAHCRGGVLDRVYLTDRAESDAYEGTVCLRTAHHHVVPVGDKAAADVAKYLKDVTPPDLVISTRPRDGTLAGLPTWFAAHAPSRLRPTPFGSGQITETITIHPMRSKWQFGDGTAVTRTATATARHTYLRGGHRRGRLTTRWGATYTISYAGGSYGPYHATGTLVRRQRFSMPVHTSRPVLVSH